MSGDTHAPSGPMSHVMNPLATLDIGQARDAPLRRTSTRRASAREGVERRESALRRRSTLRVGNVAVEDFGGAAREGDRDTAGAAEGFSNIMNMSMAINAIGTGNERVARMRAMTMQSRQMLLSEEAEAIPEDEGDVEDGAPKARKEQRIYSLFETTRILTPILREYIWWLALIMLTTATIAVCRALIPRVMSDMYDAAVAYYTTKQLNPESPTDALRDKTTDALRQFCILTSIQAAVAFLDSFVETVVTGKMQIGISRFMMSRMMRKNVSFFADYSTGELMERVFHEMNPIITTYSIHFPVLICSLIKSVYGFYECTRMHPYFLLVALSLRPARVLIAFVTAHVMQRRGRAITDLQANALGILQDVISRIRRVIVENGRVHALSKYMLRIFEFEQYIFVTSLLSGSLTGIAQVFALANELIFTSFGMMEIVNGRLTIGEYLSFSLYSDLITSAFDEFFSAYSSLAELLAASSRAIDILANTDDVETCGNPHVMALMGTEGKYVIGGQSIMQEAEAWEPHPFDATVEFQNVCFSYPHRAHFLALNRFSLSVPRAGNVAIVGPSGSGKSTVISILTRLYDVEDGQGVVNLGGANIATLCPSFVRRKVACVTQEPMLFSDTIRYNCTFGLFKHVPDDQIMRAAKLARAEEFIRVLPNGLDTLVGDDPCAVSLSTGQAQRIMLTALFVRSPAIVLLDECTSALDNATEREIMSAMRAHVYGSSTVLAVTHRLETLRGSDRVVCVDAGRIRDDGEFDALKADGSEAFRRLVQETAAG